MKSRRNNERKPDTTRRVASRKHTEVRIDGVKLCESRDLLFKEASLKNLSSTGVLLTVIRTDIVNKSFRGTLTLDGLLNSAVSLALPGMKIPLEGIVTRTKPLGKGSFEVAIDIQDDAPAFWRECLVDLMPTEDGEF